MPPTLFARRCRRSREHLQSTRAVRRQGHNGSSKGGSVRAQVSGTRLADATPWAGGTFGEALLAPTAIYVRRLLSLMDAVPVKAPRPCLYHALYSTARQSAGDGDTL